MVLCPQRQTALASSPVCPAFSFPTCSRPPAQVVLASPTPHHKIPGYQEMGWGPPGKKGGLGKCQQ